jgi:lipopolysaccharide export system permease protein
VVLGIIASIFSFFFDDIVVIPTLRVKNEIYRFYLHQQRQESNSDIVIKVRNSQLIYSVDYYDSSAQILNGLSIVELDPRGEFISQIRATQALWTGEYWELQNPVIYQWENGILRIRALPPNTSYREDPDLFRRKAVNVEELPARDAGLLVNDLKAAGLPFIEALANFHHRFSWAATPFIVMILSISMGGRFRKIILLMSLLSSLSAAVLFYVMEMITMMMARTGYIPPLVGAWFPVFAFIVIGLLLLRGAKT